MKTYSRVYASINLDAIESNMQEMRKNLKPGTKIMAIIKADGYGHGAVPIAHMLENMDYIWGYGVATLDEALVLKNSQVQKPILVLGCVFPDQYLDMLRHNIRMNVYTEEMAKTISEIAQREGLTAYMHIKMDTGMTRLGFSTCKESIEAIERISKFNNVCLEGIFTHMAKADETDKTYTYKQLRDFHWIVQSMKERNIVFKYEHCANSASIIDVPETNFNMVRAGISTYGLYPSEEVQKNLVRLEPAMTLKSHIAFVNHISAGVSVSYGGTFVSDKPMKIATIPVGYGDGYPRSLSNVGYVLIRGKKAPILGRVCMDQFMVDVTNIEDVKFGDSVTLIGNDGDETITVEMLSDLSGRFNYEFVCDLGKRIPRVYVRNKKITEQVDCFS